MAPVGPRKPEDGHAVNVKRIRRLMRLMVTAGVGRWITFYNHQRPRAAHGGQPPAAIHFNQIKTDQRGQRVAQITPAAVQAMGRRSPAAPDAAARHRRTPERRRFSPCLQGARPLEGRLKFADPARPPARP